MVISAEIITIVIYCYMSDLHDVDDAVAAFHGILHVTKSNIIYTRGMESQFIIFIQKLSNFVG